MEEIQNAPIQETELIKYKGEVSTITINSKDTYLKAIDIIANAKRVVKSIKDFYKPFIDERKARLEEVQGKQKEDVAKWEALESKLRPMLSTYEMEERRRADEERRLAEIESEKQIEAEKKKLTAKLATLKSETKIEETKIALETVELRTPVSYQKAEVTKSERSASGALASIVEDIEIEIFDAKLFIQWVLKNCPEKLDDFVKITNGQVKRYVKATKKSDIPGIKVSENNQVRIKA